MNPFVRLFNYGNNGSKEGYWTYDHMVLQCEDIMDFLRFKFGSKYDYYFLFDHSCGHNKTQPDGLNANNINVKYEGKQTIMHPTIIDERDGYIGKYTYPNTSQLKVKDAQTSLFGIVVYGPFWTTKEEANANKLDVVN